MCEVVGDEVRAFEEQEYITEGVTLQGHVQSNPVCILKDTQIKVDTQLNSKFDRP